MNNDNDEDIKDLIIARLSLLPEDTEVSIGSEGEFTRKELISAVRKGDKIGKKVVEVELNYLKSLKNITHELLSNE